MIRKWISESVEIFKRIMPPIAAPLPGINVTDFAHYHSTRGALVEQTGAIITDAPDNACLEYIHGEKGYAILVIEDRVPMSGHTAYDQEFFMHCLWHELGHFYAISTEETDLHRFNDAPWTDDNRNRKRGYWFWGEFIAECISNHVGFKLRASGSNYHPEMIRWEADIWIPVSDKVEDNLHLIYGDSRIDEYELAHYFALLLSDDMVKLFVEAGRSGKLLNDDGSPSDEEPTYISKMDERMHEPMWRILGILEDQMGKAAFWMTNEDMLEEIGTLIFQMDGVLKEIDAEVEAEFFED